MFIYLVYLKDFLEEESVYALASCIANETTLDDTCNNLHDLGYKLYNYRGDTLMRELIKNPIFDSLHTLFISDDTYIKHNIEIKYAKFFRDFTAETLKSSNQMHLTDFYQELNRIVPENLDNRDKVAANIFLAYSDRKKAAPIDRFSVDVKNKIETYLSQSLQSNSVPFDSSTLSSIVVAQFLKIISGETK